MSSQPSYPQDLYAASPILRQVSRTTWTDGPGVGPQHNLNSSRSVRDNSTTGSAGVRRDPPRRSFRSRPRLFAVIFAINVYKDPAFRSRSLRGAEADAASFKAYFEEYLQVPSDRIIMILGKEATRAKIIRAFKRLETDDRIQPGDPIFIFFAGHGSKAKAHERWEAGGPGSEIQMLLPYDFSPGPGHQVPGIPDRTIGALIDRIARAKGDNITVVFDCCNSASGTRSAGDSDTRVRSLDLNDEFHYDPAVDADILYDGTRGSRPAPLYEHGGLKSHILLAACGSLELAVESNGRGNFSSALLNLLKRVPPDELRYCELLGKMDHIPNQNPHCEGFHKQRFLFDTTERRSIPDRFPVRREYQGIPPNQTTRLVLDAGAAQGIVLHSRFKEQRQGAKLTVTYVDSYNSVLHCEPDIYLELTEPSEAELVHVGPREDLRLYVHPQDYLRHFIKLTREDPQYRFKYSFDNVVLVDHPAKANLAARLSSDRREIVFDMVDERATRFGFNHRFPRIQADSHPLAVALGGACRFFRALDLARKSQSAGGGPVSLEFYELQPDDYDVDESGEPVLHPVGNNLCQNGIIDFVVDEDAAYGFKLINNVDRDCYASAFFFDFSKLSIEQRLAGPVATNHYKPDYCLPRRRGSLTVGYGSGGVRPMAFDLHGQDMDVGFLKVIYSTSAIDLSHLEQISPFSMTRGTKEYQRKSGGIWDSLLIPVIQRRYPASLMSNSRVSSPTPVETDNPRLFALIIGINEYKVAEFSTLRGAKSDALAFKKYLENDLQVPPTQIKTLLNAEATRSNILQAFDEMGSDPTIVKGDALVVFYAGHGAERPVDPANPVVKMQMLVPHDFSSDPMHRVAPITDRELERSIGNIAAEKGDNITVIFDCCHSASGTRDIDQNSAVTVVRSIEIEVDLHDSFDHSVPRDLPAEIAGMPMPRQPQRKSTIDFRRPAGLQSHVLLSACGESEQAKETNGRGNFSVAFLKLLRTRSPDQLRYCDVVTMMDAIQGQNPQIQGDNASRVLFNAKAAGRSRTFPVEFGGPDMQGCFSVTMEAGSAHGVTLGAQFTIYSASDVKLERPLVSSTVKSTTGFTSTLEDLQQFHLSGSYVAIQTKPGLRQKEDLRLYIPPNDGFHDLFKALQEDTTNSRYDLENILLVPDPTLAHIKVTVEAANAHFEVTDGRVTEHGLLPVKIVTSQYFDRMGRIFGHIAHFYRELGRTNTNSDTHLTGQVHVEFYQLDEKDDSELEPIGKNICVGDVIDVVVDEEVPYGMKLINQSSQDLYPYLFWFDSNDLSIKDCYLSPALSITPYKQDVPLPKRKKENGFCTNGVLNIGFGSGGGREPFSFVLNAGQHLDVSVFKLFLSTKPLDLSYIPQTSPFQVDRGLGQWQPKKPRVDRWDTKLVTVVQRRVPLSNDGNSIRQ
ncbi:hypothetical protein CVT26_015516 [Gymnopilus dilepis]|uniref:Peptidase C14 caspase domain-containing protein n=1 Tax=Gymnopilus dilepis TaxID=231916 RepID=A0A409YD23_9AGAR|nr:hypothetical protein CVT26_015516 [Gymnopilus dilepis]